MAICTKKSKIRRYLTGTTRKLEGIDAGGHLEASYCRIQLSAAITTEIEEVTFVNNLCLKHTLDVMRELLR
jgi:hypothetical protein